MFDKPTSEKCIQYQNNLKNTKKHARIDMRVLYKKGDNNGSINNFSCNIFNYRNSKY